MSHGSMESKRKTPKRRLATASEYTVGSAMSLRMDADGEWIRRRRTLVSHALFRTLPTNHRHSINVLKLQH